MVRYRLSPLGLYATIAYILTLLPILLVLAASFTAAGYISFPPKGLGIGAYLAILDNPGFIEAAMVSFIVAVGASLSSSVLGIPAAMALTRYRFPGRDFLSTFFLSPLMLPTIVLGLATYLVYVRVGITKTPLSVIIGYTILTTPYVIRVVGASLAGFDRSLELAARNLGASAWESFRRVTLPIIMPGVIAGAIFAFIVAWNDVDVAIFLASARSPTLPVRIFAYMQDAAVDPVLTAVGSILIFLALIALVVIERTLGIGKVFGAQ